MATQRDNDNRAEMRALMKRAKAIDTKDGALARLLFHKLAVKAGMQSSVPPWILENAREQGVQL